MWVIESLPGGIQSACNTSALKITTSSHGLRPAELLRSASCLRSSPLINAAFSFGRNDSHATNVAIGTSGLNRAGFAGGPNS